MWGIRAPTQKELRDELPRVAEGWRNADPLEVPELTELRVEGTVPPGLRGTFFRNGPGFNVVYGQQLKHPIDGDGLVAGVSFADGRVFFRSRFVNTKTHEEEKAAGRMLYDGQMGSRAPKDGKKPGWRDPAHTNVALMGTRLIAMHEYALPHALDPNTLETIGQDTFGGALELRTMSAHFRNDPDMDRVVTVAFKPGVPLLKRPPFVSFYEFDMSCTKLLHAARHSLKDVNYAHDFGLSPSWYLVHVSPFIDTTDDTLKAIQAGKLTAGETTKYVPGAASQFVLIQRGVDAKKAQVVRVDVEPFHIYHYANVREDPATGAVTFQACCLPPNFNMDWQHRAFLSNSADAPGIMREFTIDPRDGGSLSARPLPGLETTGCEFPTTNPWRSCVRDPAVSTRFFYLMASRPGVALPFSDVVKYNTATGKVQRWHSGGVVGEPCFVPRLGRASAKSGDEDDGWVVVQVREGEQVSFCVLDARRIAAGPVCRAVLPFHLPYAFHGTWADGVVPEVAGAAKAKL
ncbi:carotenoid oxygenase [Hyaloraphidium curvatum]|nr:carotenoid oxygenase [Hyaloraphidium curvatum]